MGVHLISQNKYMTVGSFLTRRRLCHDDASPAARETYGGGCIVENKQFAVVCVCSTCFVGKDVGLQHKHVRPRRRSAGRSWDDTALAA